MIAALMQLKVVLPTRVYLDLDGISRIVVETPAGAYGFLPQRLDCVSAVAPGILTYETADGSEVFVAHDEGVLVKYGSQVLLSVRRAFTGTDLTLMQRQLNEQIMEQGEEEHAQQQLQTRLESGFLRRFAEFRDA